MVTWDLAEGNPGCLSFMQEAYFGTIGTIDPFKVERAFRRMQDNNIRGSKLYMLWNDCCNRNTVFAVLVMLNQPLESIIKHINYEGGRGIPYTPEEMEKIKKEDD